MDIENDINNIRSIYDILNSIIDKYDEDINYFEDNDIKDVIKLISGFLNKLNEDHQFSIDKIKEFIERMNPSDSNASHSEERIRKISFDDNFNLNLIKDVNCSEDDNKSIDSNLTNFSIDSYEDLYGDKNDENTNRFNKTESIDSNHDHIESKDSYYNSQNGFIDSDNENSENSNASHSKQNQNHSMRSDSIDKTEVINSNCNINPKDNLNDSNTSHSKQKQKTNNGKDVTKIKEEFINNTFNFSEIILYKEMNQLSKAECNSIESNASHSKHINRLNNYLENVSFTY